MICRSNGHCVLLLIYTTILVSTVKIQGTDDYITLVTDDDKKVIVSKKAAQYSETLKSLCTISVNSEIQPKEFSSKLFGHKILTRIAHMLEERALLTNPYTLKNDIYSIARHTLKKYKNKQERLKTFLSGADFLDIPFLLNAIAQYFVHSQSYDDIKTIIDKKSLPEKIIVYLKKQCMIAGNPECEIGQYLKKTYPGKRLDLFRKIYEWDFNIRSQKITSLKGIELIPKTIDTLELTDNYILDQSCDPNCPIKPFNQFKLLTILNLSDNLLWEPTPHMFDGLDNLIELNLSKNSIKTIHKETFQSIKKLQILWLNANLLQEIDPHTFDNLENLEELYLGNNYLSTIQKNTFKDLTSLTILGLYRNKLTVCKSDTLNGLSNLRALHLCNNKIQSLDQNTFYHTPKLYLIDLKFNQLKNLTQHIFDPLTDLKILRLYSNEIATIEPGTFKALIKLVILDLKSNKLKNLTENMFTELNNLSHLNLNHNEIQEIHEKAFRCLKKISKLSICNNQLETFSVNLLHGLNNLQEIDQSKNPFKKHQQNEIDTFIHRNKKKILIRNMHNIV